MASRRIPITPTKRLRRLAAGSVLAAFSILSGPAAAQPDAATSLVFRIPRLSQLIINGDTSALLTLTADGTGEAAFDAGGVESAADATSLTLSTNDSWDLSARLGGGWSCPGTYDKSENDLFVRIANTPIGTIQNGAAAYTNLTGADLTILSHASPVTDNVVQIQTRVLLDWTKDIPGSYAITVTYTLVTHVP
jgi:hypothetical protein